MKKSKFKLLFEGGPSKEGGLSPGTRGGKGEDNFKGRVFTNNSDDMDSIKGQLKTYPLDTTKDLKRVVVGVEGVHLLQEVSKEVALDKDTPGVYNKGEVFLKTTQKDVLAHEIGHHIYQTELYNKISPEDKKYFEDNYSDVTKSLSKHMKIMKKSPEEAFVVAYSAIKYPKQIEGSKSFLKTEYGKRLRKYGDLFGGLRESKFRVLFREMGTEKSGNWGHKGRPGEQGGSSSEGGEKILPPARAIPISVIRYATPETETTDSFRGGTWYMTPDSPSYVKEFEGQKNVGGSETYKKEIPIKNALVIENAELLDGSFAVINSGYEDYLPVKERLAATSLYEKSHEDINEKTFDKVVRTHLSSGGFSDKQISDVLKSKNKFDAAMDLIISKGLKKNGYDALVLENKYKGEVIDRHIFKLAESQLTEDIEVSGFEVDLERSMFQNVDAIVATQGYTFFNESGLELMQEAGYRYCWRRAVLDEKTCEKCLRKNGTVAVIDDARYSFPSYHVNCSCYCEAIDEGRTEQQPPEETPSEEYTVPGLELTPEEGMGELPVEESKVVESEDQKLLVKKQLENEEKQSKVLDLKEQILEKLKEKIK